MNSYIVYCHINKLNNKKYIGITSQAFSKRCGNYGQYYLNQTNGKYHQPKFARAILKYGWDNFEHIILAKHLSEDGAKQLEIELVNLYKTTDSKFGYNITIGGEGNLRYKTQEEKLQASIRNKANGYAKHKNKLQSDHVYHQHMLAIRRVWYKNKIIDPKYKNYVLEKSKISHLRHKNSLTKDEQLLETKRHTELVRQNRLDQKNKKQQLKEFIQANLDKFSVEIIEYIKNIKWYKIQSLKQLEIIEQKLKN